MAVQKKQDNTKDDSTLESRKQKMWIGVVVVFLFVLVVWFFQLKKTVNFTSTKNFVNSISGQINQTNSDYKNLINDSPLRDALNKAEAKTLQNSVIDDLSQKLKDESAAGNEPAADANPANTNSETSDPVNQ